MRISTNGTQRPNPGRLTAARHLAQERSEDGSCSPSVRCQSAAQRLAKRSLDLGGAATILLLALPILAIAAVLIRLTSRGPILFRQTRVGKDGQRFALYKLRTMFADNDDAAHRAHYAALIAGSAAPVSGTFKLIDDPRITAVGRYLRKLSIDELPQMFNILRGEMSLVGPRPPLPYEVELYDEAAQRRLAVKPGITGLWQVRGRNALNFHQMIDLDLEYIRCWSVLLDVQILLLTPWAVIKAVGAG